MLLLCREDENGQKYESCIVCLCESVKCSPLLMSKYNQLSNHCHDNRNLKYNMHVVVRSFGSNKGPSALSRYIVCTLSRDATAGFAQLKQKNNAEKGVSLPPVASSLSQKVKLGLHELLCRCWF